jgi:hypothetical protein
MKVKFTRPALTELDAIAALLAAMRNKDSFAVSCFS